MAEPSAAGRVRNLKEAREEISLIKFYVANVMMNVVDRAIQAHGALGISDDTVLSTFYRAGRAARTCMPCALVELRDLVAGLLAEEAG